MGRDDALTTPPLHVLDHSVLNRLVESDVARLRHRLITEAEAGRILIPATHPLTWELGPTRAVNDAKYRAMVELLLRISRGRFLLDAPGRIVKELQRGRSLTYPDYLDPDHGMVPVFDPEVIDEAAAGHLGRSRGEMFCEAEQASDSADALIALDQDWRETLIEAFRTREYTFDLADHYARETTKDFEGLAEVDVPLVDPRALPTVWSHALIHTARVRAVMVARVSPTGRRSPKSLDLLHLKEAAAYGDVFVCLDRSLRAFAGTVTDLRCEVLDFEDWAARFT